MRHLIDISDFSRAELDMLIALGRDIAARPRAYARECEGKILAALFFEPSTRTRLSFESAMLSLGGQVLGFSESSSSSASKGESVADTARMASCYADVIAMRHPLEGAPMLAAQAAGVPVINAGDGGHCHPTQTLTDLLTLSLEKGSLDGLTVGLCGDLKYGRTVHSLINALALYRDVKITLISPPELAIPQYMKTGALARMEYRETSDLAAALPALDVLYMTRVQRERFDDPAQYERLKDSYILDAEKMALAAPGMTVLHPLPRVNEISVKVDSDPRAAYFRQAQNGKYIRMALLMSLIQGRLESKPLFDAAQALPSEPCQNPKCATRFAYEHEHFAVPDGEGGLKCPYCEMPLRSRAKI